ncbi:MAG TPA: hypothetical protein VHT24_12435, partial [Pseudacidobacterium sp.]|nr:hypothetical protein [Pseudacidobacterium sp.]
MKSGPGFQQRLAVVALCCLVSSSGFTQTAPSQEQQQQQQPAPAPQSAPATPDAPNATAQQQPPSPPSIAQQAEQAQQAVASQQPFHVEMPRSRNPFSPYRPSTVPELNLTNSPRLQQLIRDGKIYLSLQDAIALAIENNLDLAYFRYNMPISDMDIARTKAGGTARGVNTAVQQQTQGGFGSSSGGASANTSSGATAAGAGGLVQSTLGSGTVVNSFDPQLTLQTFVDHSTTQEP